MRILKILIIGLSVLSSIAYATSNEDRWWNGYVSAFRAGEVTNAVGYIQALRTNYTSQEQAEDNANAIVWFLTTGGKGGFAKQSDGSYRTATDSETKTMEESFLFALHFRKFHVFQDGPKTIENELKGHFLHLQALACAYNILTAPVAPLRSDAPKDVFQYQFDLAGKDHMLCTMGDKPEDVQIWKEYVLPSIIYFAAARVNLLSSDEPISNARSTTPSDALVLYSGDFHIPQTFNYNDFAPMLNLATPELNKRIRVSHNEMKVWKWQPVWRFVEDTTQEDIDNFIRVSAQVKSLQECFKEPGWTIENGWLVNRTSKQYNDGFSMTMRRFNISFYPNHKARPLSMAEMFKEIVYWFFKSPGGRQF